MLQQRKCKECGASFQGGPRAWYCPSCRAERIKARDRLHKQKIRNNPELIRKIGSEDTCKRCGNSYFVEGSLQQFCVDCRPIHTAEFDRNRAMPKYEKSKEILNPVRNARRRIDPIKVCVICGNNFDHEGTKRLTCSEACEKEWINKRWRERYHKNRPPQ